MNTNGSRIALSTSRLISLSSVIRILTFFVAKKPSFFVDVKCGDLVALAADFSVLSYSALKIISFTAGSGVLSITSCLDGKVFCMRLLPAYSRRLHYPREYALLHFHSRRHECGYENLPVLILSGFRFIKTDNCPMMMLHNCCFLMSL